MISDCACDLVGQCDDCDIRPPPLCRLLDRGPVIVIGLYRALEIVVGCLVAAALNLVAERLLDPMQIVRE